jgi:hypothetical protein
VARLRRGAGLNVPDHFRLRADDPGSFASTKKGKQRSTSKWLLAGLVGPPQLAALAQSITRKW